MDKPIDWDKLGLEPIENTSHQETQPSSPLKDRFHYNDRRCNTERRTGRDRRLAVRFTTDRRSGLDRRENGYEWRSTI